MYFMVLLLGDRMCLTCWRFSSTPGTSLTPSLARPWKGVPVGCDGIFEKVSSQQLVTFLLPFIRRGAPSHKSPGMVSVLGLSWVILGSMGIITNRSRKSNDGWWWMGNQAKTQPPHFVCLIRFRHLTAAARHWPTDAGAGQRAPHGFTQHCGIHAREVDILWYFGTTE